MYKALNCSPSSSVVRDTNAFARQKGYREDYIFSVVADYGDGFQVYGVESRLQDALKVEKIHSGYAQTFVIKFARA